MKLTLIMISMVAFSVAGCGRNETASGDLSSSGVPSGVYAVDRQHTYLSFSYLHQGLSYPLLRATDVMGELYYDNANMSNSSIGIVVAADSIRTNVAHFDKELTSRKFFNADKFPHITFISDRYESAGDATGVLYGNVTIRGITKPLELAVTFNDGIVHPVLEVPVLGFSASGSLKRSEFGLDRFVPVVSDTVLLSIEVEFLHGSTDESAAAAKVATDAA